jgi:hypothetical protein
MGGFCKGHGKKNNSPLRRVRQALKDFELQGAAPFGF